MVCAGLGMAGVWYFASGASSSRVPRVMLWAWERPEDLSFLDCHRAGVAILAATISLGPGGMRVEPRRQPLTLPDDCPTVAVVRIEAGEGPVGTDMVEPAARELVRVAGRPGIRALQIDFDAVVSQRPFYRALLERVRSSVPRDLELTITALASWCLWDNWIDGLPIDDAVPMLFEMGLDDRQVRAHLNGGGDLRSRICQASLGLSTGEWPTAVPAGRRIYVFHARSWTPAVVSNTLNATEGLQ